MAAAVKVAPELAASAVVTVKARARLYAVRTSEPYRKDPEPAESPGTKLPVAAAFLGMDDPPTAIAYAKAYAQRGFTPVLLKRNEKVPAFVGWQAMPASTVVEILRAGKKFNIGIAIPDGYVVIDIDVKKGAKGLETLRDLEDKFGPLEGMLVARTPSGGWHFIFKLPPGVKLKNAVKIAPGIDIRVLGGIIGAEPSVIDGKSYGFDDWDPLTEPMPDVAVIPDWLLALCPKRDERAPDSEAPDDDATIVEGHRNDALYRKACALRGQGLNKAEMNTALQSVNDRLCRPPLPQYEVARIADSASKFQPNPLPMPLNRAQRREFALQLRTAARLFVGGPKPVEWLVEFRFPSGKVAFVASAPGLGKSMSALYLALQLTMPASNSILDRDRFAFGRRVRARGRVIYITAEDDEEEIHRRLHALLKGQPMPDLLHIVSLPDLGHFTVLQGDGRGAYSVSPEWQALKDEIQQLDNVVAIIVDTLQAVSMGDLNAAENAQAMMNELVQLANQTRAAVIVLHHLVKFAAQLEKGLLSSHNAMDAIRGSGALAGSARTVYCFFSHPHGKEICETLGIDYEQNKVVYGLVAKANGVAHRDYTIYVRDENGVLCDCTFEYNRKSRDSVSLLDDELVEEVTKAYHAGVPFAVSTTSAKSLQRRRKDMPKQFQTLSSAWFVEHAEALVEEGKLQKRRVKNGQQYVPVVPIAPVAQGAAVAEEAVPPVLPKAKRAAARKKPSKRTGAK